MASMNDYIDSINYSIESIRKNKDELLKAADDLPSDFKIMMSMNDNAKDSRALQFIFDTKLDRVIDNLLNKVMIGDYSDIEMYANMIKKVFDTMGIGEGAFEGPVSQALMRNITNSLNSIDFSVTKSKIKKCMILIRNLKYQSKFIKDKEVKRKYLEAVHALKQTLKFIAKVYKDRRIITNRVMTGLKYAVQEDYTQIQEEFDYDFDLANDNFTDIIPTKGE